MYEIIVQCAVVVLSFVVSVRTMEEKTSMYMKRSEVSDQSMSGSGYSYNGENGKPQEYSFELGDNDHSLKILEDLGYDPFEESSRYAEENLPLPYDQYVKEYTKIAEEKPSTFLKDDNNYKIPKPKVKVPTYPSLYPAGINEYRKLGLYPTAYPYATGYNRPNHKDSVKKWGKLYDDTTASKYGEKVDTNYKTVDEISKGLKGKYDNQDKKSFFGLNGGKKHLVFDSAGNYAVKQAAGKASRGGSFGQKDYHNNGAKTTGYHKVYHKDDYNKQHKFYDKADKSGHFNKYGDFNAKEGSEDGQFAQGAHQDKGYEANKYGLSDVSDKGKFEEVAKGFRKADGNEAFYQNYDAFSKKGGQENGSSGGYKF